MNEAAAPDDAQWSLEKCITVVQGERTTTAEARKAAKNDARLYHGQHWTKTQKEELADREQAPAVDNQVRRKINFLMGMEQARRSDPKAFARTPKHMRAAEVATDTLRADADRLRWKRKKSHSARDLWVYGVVAAEVSVKPSRRDGLVNALRRIEYDDFIADPLSREHDFSDAKWLGYSRWTDEDDLLRQYPDKRELILSSYSAAAGSASMSDTDDNEAERVYWHDRSRNRLFVVRLFYKQDGEWYFKTFVHGGELEAGPSPYRDEDNVGRCPIIAQSCYVDRELQRYGVVRDLEYLQREINQRLSKMLYELVTDQTWSIDGAIENLKKFRAEKRKPNGHLLVPSAPGELWGTVDKSRDIAGHAALLQDHRQALQTHGPNSALVGRGVEQQSGLAIQAQQNAGQMEESEPHDLLDDWEDRVFEAMWLNIKQFATSERVVRITDDPEAPKFITLNEPILGPDGATYKRNAPALMDVDIIIDRSADITTLRQEQFQVLASLAEKYGPQAVPFEIMLELAEVRSETRRKLDELKSGGNDPQAQQMQALRLRMEQAAAQLELQAKQLENAETQADIDETIAKTRKFLAEAQEVQARLRGQHPEQIMDAVQQRASMMRVAAA